MAPDDTPLITIDRIPPERLAAVRILATDVDGTLTRGGEFSHAVLADLEALREAGVEVVPVTGRSAGEALALARYLPGVRRALAENGLVAVAPDQPHRLLFAGTEVDKFISTKEHLSREFSIAPCAPFRMADVAFERGDRTDAQLAALADRVRGAGLYASWSSVHFHLCPAPPDKGAGLHALLAEDGIDPSAVVTIGDAPNDAGMWRWSRAGGLAVGTAEVVDRWAWIAEEARPEALTGPGVDGWRTLVAALLAAR